MSLYPLSACWINDQIVRNVKSAREEYNEMAGEGPDSVGIHFK